MSLQVLIIEDEPLASEKLAGFIHRYQPAAEIVAVLPSLAAVLDFFDQPAALSVQLVISDIALQDGPVFQALQQIVLPCPLLLVSAYADYALQAMAQQAVGYLLKPYSYQSFAKALDDIFVLKQKLARLTVAADPAQAQRAGYQALTPTASPAATASSASTASPAAGAVLRQRFLIRQHSGLLVPLAVAHISCIQAVRGVLVATAQNGQQHVLSETQLSELAAELEPLQFFRLNRSELIRLGAVLQLENHGKDHLAVYLQGVAAPLLSSKNRTAELRQQLSR